ncbi:MAG: hypothetical protein NTY38_00085, partial [Acidobacteria bacterium]|nr:hypothetical protein [Acidobacteriota bacterium]
EDWLLPNNTAEILESLRWAAGGRFSAEISGPPALVAEISEKPAHGLTMVHLLNYEFRQPVRDVQIDLSLRQGQSVARIDWLSPDDEAVNAITFRQDGSRVRFRVREIAQYGLAVLKIRSGRAEAKP